jgi:hypothetical protein
MTKTFVTELKSREARTALADALLALFKQWGIHQINQIELLGMRDLTKLQQGKPLPDEEEVLERAGQLLAIERTLKKLYPYHPGRRDDWIFKRNPMLDGIPPINLMLEGVDGIKKVRELVDSLV